VALWLVKEKLKYLKADIIAMAKKPWHEIISDNDFMRNFVILLLVFFVFIGIIILFLTGNLEMGYYRSSIDIAIGLVIGTGLLKLLKGKKNG